MRKIKEMVERIDEELESAKDYAERYTELKVDGDVTTSNKYKEMANDEIRHSGIIHDEVVSIINRYKQSYTPPQEMLDKWDREHKKYIEKSNWIKLIMQG